VSALGRRSSASNSPDGVIGQAFAAPADRSNMNCLPERIRRLRLFGVCVIVLAAVWVPGEAGAQNAVVASDSAGGYDHVSDPPSGAFSSVDWCFAFAGEDLVGQTIEVEAEGPDGPLSGTGVVAANGTVKVRVGITAGGRYTVTGIVAVESGTTISNEGVESVDVVFDPEVVDCADQITVAPPPTTEQSTTTSTTTTSTTTTSTTTTSTAVTAPTTIETVSTPPLVEPDGGGDTNWPLIAVGTGLVLLLFGLLIAFWPGVTVGTTTNKCDRELKEVERLEAELAKQRKTLDGYKEKRTVLEKEAHALEFSDAPGTRRQQVEEHRRELVKNAERLSDKIGHTHSHIKELEKDLEKAKKALKDCLAGKKSGGNAGGGTAPPSTPPSTEEKPTPCCEKGNWIGINTYMGGGSGYGRDIGTLYLMCIDDTSRTAVISWNGERVGIFIGAELSISVFVLANSGRHPTELEADIVKVLEGWDWDISVGVSWSKLLKSGAKTVKNLDRVGELVESVVTAGKASKAIKRADRAGDSAEAARLASQNKKVLEELIRDGVADDLADAVAKGTSSATQAGGEGANIPYGGGLQLGFWKAIDVVTDVVSIDGCKTCDASKR